MPWKDDFLVQEKTWAWLSFSNSCSLVRSLETPFALFPRGEKVMQTISFCLNKEGTFYSALEHNITQSITCACDISPVMVICPKQIEIVNLVTSIYRKTYLFLIISAKHN